MTAEDMAPLSPGAAALWKGVRNPDCRACPLWEGCATVCMLGEGGVPTRGAIVGESPGWVEDKVRRPFKGDAGTYLELSLADAGIDIDGLYRTNAVKCFPGPPGQAKDKKVEAALKPCKPYLMEELRAIKPEAILILGKEALKSLTGRGGITKLAGTEWYEEQLGAWVVAAMHPAWVLRNPQGHSAFLGALQKFGRRLSGGEEPAEPEITVCMTREQVDEALKDIASWEGTFTFDLETKGFLDFRPDARVWMASFSHDPGKAWVIPLEHPESPWAGDQAYLDELYRRMKPLLEYPRRVSGHNIKYDARWAHRRGIVVNIWFDTVVAAHLINENRRMSLEYLAQTELGVPKWGKGKIKFDPPSPLSEMGPYCGRDSCHAQALYLQYREELSEQPELARLYKYGCLPGLRALLRAEINGIWVDTERLKKRTGEANDRVAELDAVLDGAVSDKLLEQIAQERWSKLSGRRRAQLLSEDPRMSADLGDGPPPLSFLREASERHPEAKIGKTRLTEINFDSGPFLQRWLFGAPPFGLGLMPRGKTAGGDQYSTDADVLELIKGEDPAVAALMERRHWLKNLQFFDKWKELLGPDQRLHPFFNITGTVTGRRSCERPNLEQVPRDPFARSVMGAPEGWVLVKVDYSQLELRIAAWMAGEPIMLLAFELGRDVHTLTAAMVTGKLEALKDKYGLPNLAAEELLRNDKLWGELAASVTKEERRMAKAVNFGFLYGMGPKKFTEYARDSYGVTVSQSEGAAFRTAYFELYAGLLPWHARQRAIAGKMYEVPNPIGRVRRLLTILSADEEVRSKAERQSVNAPVQGFGGDLNMISYGILAGGVGPDPDAVDQAECLFVNDVHDEALWQVKAGAVDRWVPVIKRVMENPRLMEYFGLDFGVPLVVEPEVGGHWGETEPWVAA